MSPRPRGRPPKEPYDPNDPNDPRNVHRQFRTPPPTPPPKKKHNRRSPDANPAHHPRLTANGLPNKRAQGNNLTLLGHYRTFHAEHRAEFLRMFEKTRCIVRAARRLGFSASSIAVARKNDPPFNEACQIIERARIDELEGSMWARAVEGHRKPVFQKGRLVGYVREWDTTLQMFMAKAHNPKVYNISNGNDGHSSEELATAIVQFITAAMTSVPAPPAPTATITDASFVALPGPPPPSPDHEQTSS